MKPENTKKDIRIVIMGAGMAGLLSAIKLREAGIDNFVIYEKADRLGGTWRENTYPGLTCDVPSHAYTYSFEPNPEWSRYLPPGGEIQAYFEGVSSKYGIDRFIHYNTEISRAVYEDGRWQLFTKEGLLDEADIVLAATGVLHHPKYPEIPGMDDFQGALFHTARWDHDVPLEGKQVGIIGTGSTGVQTVSALAGVAGQLKHFQRTAQWIMPVENPVFTEEQKNAFRNDAALLKSMQNEPTYLANVERFTTGILNPESPEMHEIESIVLANLETSVKDPELLEKLRPNYRAACKRLIFSPDYYQAIQHPQATLVSEDIECIESNGVRTQDGQLHSLDVIALATGFHADRFMRPMQVFGRGGCSLDQVWEHRPTAYMAISIPEFPNFFMLNGPNGPVGNFSLIDIAEQQWNYIAQLIELVRSGECQAVSASHKALETFDTNRIDAARTTIFGSGCNSWYLDADGIPATWPWSQQRFREEMSAPKLSDYDLNP